MTTITTSPLRQRMQQDLQLAGISERTQEAYLRAVQKLAVHFQQPPAQLSESQVRDYFQYINNDRKFSPSELKMALSGIKFFSTQTAVRDCATLLRLRVPRHRSLPNAPTIQEVHRILDVVRTSHNKAFLWTVYSLALRPQEGLSLQVGDIDSSRTFVHVHRGKVLTRLLRVQGQIVE